jgi:threonine synthase
MLKDSDYTIDFHRGTLLSEKETQGCERELAEKRRVTRSLEASPEAVLQELEATIQA